MDTKEQVNTNLENTTQSYSSKTSRKMAILIILCIILIVIILSIILFFIYKKPISNNFDPLNYQEELDKISMADKNKDNNICDTLKEVSFRDNCYLTVSHDKLDPELCNKINSSDYKEYCLRYVSQVNGNQFYVNVSRAVWMNSMLIINDTNTVNMIQYKYQFTSNETATGYLAIFLDRDLIYEEYEESFNRREMKKSGGYLGKNYLTGGHLLSIRIIPLTKEKSTLNIVNITFSFVENSPTNSYLVHPKMSLYPIDLDSLSPDTEGYNNGSLNTANGGRTFSKTPDEYNSAWVSAWINTEKSIDFIVVKKVNFTGLKGSDGVFSIYWDGKVLGSFFERFDMGGMPDTLDVFRVDLPFNESSKQSNSSEDVYRKIGLHSIGFRLDHLTPVNSSVEFKDIFLGSYRKT